MARKRPTARLWQVWFKSAAEGKGYWLGFASPDFAKAAEFYQKQRTDYMMVEFRTPQNDVYRSHDETRDPGDEVREELFWRFDVAAGTK